MSELALIERIAARNPNRAGTLLGIGDDAAVIDVGGAAVVTHDMLVEGVHFRRVDHEPAGSRAQGARRQPLRPRRHGRRAGRGASWASASRRASSRATTSTPSTPGWTTSPACHGVTVAGGDVTSCPSLVLAVTAIGRAVAGRRAGHALGGPPRRPALRHRAAWAPRPPACCCSRTPGLLPASPRAGRPASPPRRAPEPRLAAGGHLAARGAHAMMDLSDGLALDAGRLAAAGGLRAGIDLAALPAGARGGGGRRGHRGRPGTLRGDGRGGLRAAGRDPARAPSRPAGRASTCP